MTKISFIMHPWKMSKSSTIHRSWEIDRAITFYKSPTLAAIISLIGPFGPVFYINNQIIICEYKIDQVKELKDKKYIYLYKFKFDKKFILPDKIRYDDIEYLIKNKSVKIENKPEKISIIKIFKSVVVIKYSDNMKIIKNYT